MTWREPIGGPPIQERMRTRRQSEDWRPEASTLRAWIERRPSERPSGFGITRLMNPSPRVIRSSIRTLMPVRSSRSVTSTPSSESSGEAPGSSTCRTQPWVGSSTSRAMRRETPLIPIETPPETSSVEAAGRGEIDFAFLMGGNLYAASPDAVFADKALGNIPFKVFLTTTLNEGHFSGKGQNTLILPVAARDEEEQPTTQESMFNFVRMSDGGQIRLDNVRSEVEIIAAIAEDVVGNEKVNFSALKNHRHIRDAIGGIIPGFGKIKALDEIRKEFQIEGRTFHQPGFATGDKKALFTTVNIPEPNGEKGQFRMASIRSEGQFNTIIYEEYDSYRNVNHRWTVLMNTNDMMALRLKEGDKVTIENDIGSMEGVAVKGFDIPPGNVATYFPESNVLISAQSDRRSKTPGFKSTMVTIAPQIN